MFNCFYISNMIKWNIWSLSQTFEVFKNLKLRCYFVNDFYYNLFWCRHSISIKCNCCQNPVVVACMRIINSDSVESKTKRNPDRSKYSTLTDDDPMMTEPTTTLLLWPHCPLHRCHILLSPAHHRARQVPLLPSEQPERHECNTTYYLLLCFHMTIDDISIWFQASKLQVEGSEQTFLLYKIYVRSSGSCV